MVRYVALLTFKAGTAEDRMALIRESAERMLAT